MLASNLIINKNNKMKYKFLNILIFLSVLSACTKDFEEINKNPNAAEKVPATNLLVNGIVSSINEIHGNSLNLTTTGVLAQHYAEIQYIDVDNYAFRFDFLQGNWNTIYASPLMDFQRILEDETAGTNVKAAARVMKAYNMSILTDLWGHVPYSEALQDGIYNPVYDSQEFIYQDLVSELKLAVEEFNTEAEPIGEGDVIFDQDINKWIKFANSLNLRLMNRAKHKVSSYEADMNEIIASGNIMSSHDDNAILHYPGTSTNRNPIFENALTRNDHAVSATLIDLMLDLEDPRVSTYAKVNINGDYVGHVNGMPTPPSLLDVSPIGAIFIDDATAGLAMMTYDEVLYIIAELDMNNHDLLHEAVMASVNRYNLAGNAEFMEKVHEMHTADPLEAIISLKWIALFGNSPEAYSEFRRTGYPSSLKEVANSIYPEQGVPHRLPYPNLESSLNSANHEAARAAQNLVNETAAFGDEMWWVIE